MDAEEIFQVTREVCAEILGLSQDAITPSALIRDDLGADSLDLAELAIALEDMAGLSLLDARFDDVKTVQDVVDAIQNHESTMTS